MGTLAYGQADKRACPGNGCLKLFEFSIEFGKYCRLGPPPQGTGCRDPNLRGQIANISMSNIDVKMNGVPLVFSRLTGNSTIHDVNGVSIRGVTMDGVRATSLGDLNATINGYVRHVSILPPAMSLNPVLV